jgi:Vacuolar protein sorting-associated protein 35
MQVFDELRSLESYLNDEYPKRNKKLVELYESVQQASAIVPRFYRNDSKGKF